MKASKFIITTIFTVLCISFLLGACGNQHSTNSNSDSVSLSTASKDVKAVFQARCISCHGSDLAGRIGEQTNLQHVYERLSYDEIVDAINNGGDIMQPFEDKLSEKEISELAAWLSKQ